MTGRALIVGLGYTLIWEGVLAGLLEGTRFLSVRQATLGVASALTGENVGADPLGVGLSMVILVAVSAGGLAVHGRGAASVPASHRRLTAPPRVADSREPKHLTTRRRRP